MNGVEIIKKTLPNRKKLFFHKLDQFQSTFKDLYVGNLKYSIPIEMNTTTKRYYKYKVKAPISFYTNKKYAVRLNDSFYQLHRGKDTLCFIKMVDSSTLSNKDICNFFNTTQFSYVFYLFTKILEELKSSNTPVEVIDSVFKNLTEEYSTKGASTKVYLSLRPDEEIKLNENTIKLSIFN